MNKMRIQLRAVFYEEGGFWIAHCLEMDVMGHAKTKSLAFSKMCKAIKLQLDESVRHHNVSNIFMPADAKYFAMYAFGKDIARGELVIGSEALSKKPPPKHLPKKGRISQFVETREYEPALAL